MIFPSNRVRIMIATKPVDFRKGHDGLAALVKNELREERFTGTVFVLRARRADRLKLLYRDGTGDGLQTAGGAQLYLPAIRDGLMTLNHAQFAALFSGLDLRRVRGVETRAPETVE